MTPALWTESIAALSREIQESRAETRAMVEQVFARLDGRRTDSGDEQD